MAPLAPEQEFDMGQLVASLSDDDLLRLGAIIAEARGGQPGASYSAQNSSAPLRPASQSGLGLQPFPHHRPSQRSRRCNQHKCQLPPWLGRYGRFASFAHNTFNKSRDQNSLKRNKKSELPKASCCKQKIGISKLRQETSDPHVWL